MISGKFINSSSIGGTQIRLDNAQYLRARNFANTGDVNILQVTSGDIIQFASLPVVSGSGSLALQSGVDSISTEVAALSDAVGLLASSVDSLNNFIADLQNSVQELNSLVRRSQKESFDLTGPVVSDIDIPLSFSPLADSMFCSVAGAAPVIFVEGDDYSITDNTLTLLSASSVVSGLTGAEVIRFQYLY